MESYSYSSPMARLSQLQVTLGGSSLFNRSYGYDVVGNVRHIMNNVSGENQVFGYDSLDRLSSWSVTNTNQLYSYDPIGNLTNKNGTAYAYGSNGNGTGAGPHQARNVGGQQFSYDTIGNLTSKAGITYFYGRLVNGYRVGPHQVTATSAGGGTPYDYDANGNLIYVNYGGDSAYIWNADNQPTSITTQSGWEQYTYDADGGRVSRTHNGYATVYLGPLFEKDTTNPQIRRKFYTFGGKVVAQTTSSGNNDGVETGGTFIYMNGDHLGSISLTTDTYGNLISRQEFKPWGEERVNPPITQTPLNYTGQRKDSTGLLYYNARYYDPNLSRFISADTVVPGSDSVKGLVVDYHETGYVSGVAQENMLTLQKGFYFQLSGSDKKNAKSPMGPGNPQALNRYSYVSNNPMKQGDPTGHTIYLSGSQALALYYSSIDFASANYAPDPVTGGTGAFINLIAGLLGLKYTDPVPGILLFLIGQIAPMFDSTDPSDWSQWGALAFAISHVACTGSGTSITCDPIAIGVSLNTIVVVDTATGNITYVTNAPAVAKALTGQYGNGAKIPSYFQNGKYPCCSYGENVDAYGNVIPGTEGLAGMQSFGGLPAYFPVMLNGERLCVMRQGDPTGYGQEICHH